MKNDKGSNSNGGSGWGKGENEDEKRSTTEKQHGKKTLARWLARSVDIPAVGNTVDVHRFL